MNYQILICICAGVFRGKVWKDSTGLQDCLTIITRVVQLQTLLSPLRKHFELVDEEDNEAIDEKAAQLRAAQEVIHGMRIGRPIDIRAVGGDIRGPIANADDTEPSDEDIDTGHEFKDFAKGDRVIAFWWGLFWRGKVHALSRRNETLTIRFEWSNKTISGYKPRCVHKL